MSINFELSVTAFQ